ncbi:MAG TPA: hypothetical protein VN959_05800, partial [Mycobacterium sp.]|nr:hypothetical protein [Mycobacterium sp.]
MRSLLARLAVLGAFAVSVSACANGAGTSVPFAGAPNQAGGVPGTFQSGSNGQLLLRFIQGSPDAFTPPGGKVDVCLDNQPLGITGGTAAYGQVATGGASNGTLIEVAGGGITHTLSVYPGLPSAGSPGTTAGLECATAPGPYFFNSAVAVATLATPAGSNIRWTAVLGGTAASGTLALYIFAEPTWQIPPAGNAVISHNAAPVYSTGKPGVGFGTCSTTVTPCAVPAVLVGAGNIGKPTKAGIGPTTTTNLPVTSSGLNTIPAGFYDGTGVVAGVPVPVTSVPAPNVLAGQPYVVTQYAYDGPAGGL